MSEIIRLAPVDAGRIIDCFQRVYGDSYANGLFYDVEQLSSAMAEGRLNCVGASAPDGSLIGHMAMTIHPGAATVELGNTVVDPAARGQGLAWKVGAELSAWCRELGYRGYLHYPTTDHHIMQQRSVKKGHEVGLMMGYIPAGTDGQVNAGRQAGRQAATIVYEPYSGDAPGAETTLFLPSYCSDRLMQFAAVTGLMRNWVAAENAPDGSAIELSDVHLDCFERRGLARLSVRQTGADIAAQIEAFVSTTQPCQQIDFHMADSRIEAGVTAARAAGFWFCGWLPGYSSTDVYRLQRVNRSQTIMNPALTNPVARSLLGLIPEDGEPGHFIR